jgi:hypothetical protein
MEPGGGTRNPGYLANQLGVARKLYPRYNVGRSIGAWRRPASALAWGARGRRFKSSRPDTIRSRRIILPDRVRLNARK